MFYLWVKIKFIMLNIADKRCQISWKPGDERIAASFTVRYRVSALSSYWNPVLPAQVDDILRLFRAYEHDGQGVLGENRISKVSECMCHPDVNPPRKQLQYRHIGCLTSSVAQVNRTIKINFNI
jgi:hypothetical protein